MTKYEHSTSLEVWSLGLWSLFVIWDLKFGI